MTALSGRSAPAAAAATVLLLVGLVADASAVPLPRERPAPETGPSAAGADDAVDDEAADAPAAGPPDTKSSVIAAPAAAAGALPRLPQPRPEPDPLRAEARDGPVEPDGRTELAIVDPKDMIGPPLDPGRIVPGLPIPRPETPVTPATPEPFRVDARAVDVAALRACMERLDKLGVSYEEIEPIVGQCNIAAPLEVSAVAKGVELRPAGVMNCATAEAVARWTQESVIPAAKRELDADLAAIDQASAFVCRTRYNRPGAKVSEHAKANALDIGGFRFADAESVSIQPGREQSAEVRRFQAKIRADSCTYFTTVLGPGSNAAHATHFHLDLAERSSGYRLCELAPAVAGVGRDQGEGPSMQ